MNVTNDNLSINSVSASTYYNLPGFQTTVEVTTIIHQSPQEIITVVNRPLPTPDAPPVVYKHRTQVVTPPPIHKTVIVGEIDVNEMIRRICACTPTPMNSKEVNCVNCVRAYHSNHPNATKGDYTSKNIGCSVK